MGWRVAVAAGGIAALMAGAGVYWVARPAAAASGLATSAAPNADVWRQVLGSVPTFLHVLAFGLLASVTTKTQPTRAAAARIAVSWVGINWLCEWGQRDEIAAQIAAAIDGSCGHRWLCTYASNYFVHGSFDPLDLVAAALGGAALMGILELRKFFEYVRGMA